MWMVQVGDPAICFRAPSQTLLVNFCVPEIAGETSSPLVIAWQQLSSGPNGTSCFLSWGSLMYSDMRPEPTWKYGRVKSCRGNPWLLEVTVFQGGPVWGAFYSVPSSVPREIKLLLLTKCLLNNTSVDCPSFLFCFSFSTFSSWFPVVT